MAFRKRRTSSRKLETRAHANRVFKKVVRQWQLAVNVKCQVIETVFGPDCPNGGKVILVSQAQLAGSSLYSANANFPDALRIKRIEGHLYFRPQFVPPADTGTSACYFNVFLNQHTNYMRMGLRKAQAPESQAGVPDALNPLDNGATPEEISDYADGRWMKMWEHIWDPAVKLGGTAANAFNCCSVQDSYTLPSWVTTVGTGTWPGVVVPPIVCEPCGDVEDPAINLGCQFQVDAPRWWHCPIRYGRTIVMKENDDLGLYFGWERMRDVGDNARVDQTNMEMVGGIRLLLES